MYERFSNELPLAEMQKVCKTESARKIGEDRENR